MIQIENIYAKTSATATWMRGNLHTHTTRSDGTRPPQDVIDDYARRKYDFLMISDHDIYTSQDDYREWDARGMTMIPGNEITASGPHILHVNAASRIEPVADRQKVIDQCSGPNSFAIVNHPNWGLDFAHCKQAFLETWQGYAGIEIYNGVCEFLQGSAFASDRWDQLLTAGRKVWGFANDDHHWHETEQIEMGWNVVLADKSVESIVSAMQAGRFYASTGDVIDRIDVKSDTIAIQTQNADRIIARTDYGKRFDDAKGPFIEVRAPEGQSMFASIVTGPIGRLHGPSRSLSEQNRLAGVS